MSESGQAAPETESARALKEMAAAGSLAELQELRVEYLGKKGLITERLKALGALQPDERRAAGQAINELKRLVEGALAERYRSLLGFGKPVLKRAPAAQ